MSNLAWRELWDARVMRAVKFPEREECGLGGVFVAADAHIKALEAEVATLTAERDGLAAAPDALIWEDTNRVTFDDSVLFGKGYDFEGLECLRSELHSPVGSFVVWPNQLGGAKRWSAYGGSDGLMWFEQFNSEKEAQAAVVKYVGKLMGIDAIHVRATSRHPHVAGGY